MGLGLGTERRCLLRSLRPPPLGGATTSSPHSLLLCAPPQQVCIGVSCEAITVVECVLLGKAPLQPDAAGNIGCDNTGGRDCKLPKAIAGELLQPLQSSSSATAPQNWLN